MDSIHSSPVSVRLGDYSQDYESGADCCSVDDDVESQDLTITSMDISPTFDESVDSVCKHNQNFLNNTDLIDINVNMNNNSSHSNNSHNTTNNNSFNNYRNNLNLTSNVTQLDPKISSAIIVRNSCRSVNSQQFDKQFINDIKQTNNSSDIESQNRELRRKKSLIYRLYSNSGSNRHKHVNTRLSILGRPIPLHRMKNETAFYREKIAVYNFLQRPQGKVAVTYHICVSLVVSICLLMTIFSTISAYEDLATKSLNYMDGFIVALFSSEFVVRVWSCSCNSHYQGWAGKIRFLRNPFRLIDMFVIITSCAVLFFDTKSHSLFIYLRGFRFFQVFQMLRLEHRFRPWRLMSSVVWAQREHLAITTYMGFLSLLFISFAIYFVEKDTNPAFNSIASSMWWGVITLCTVGYGDMTPVTPFGKFLSCICIIIGVSIFALPAGILGTGLALKVQEQQRVRQLGKRREPAAKLIQWTWRCYAASVNSTSTVTWRAYPRRNSRDEIRLLTDQEKCAIRFLRIVKYFIARRQFNRAQKPYDIKDVLEQYAAGHADVLGRVKHMQSRIITFHTSVNSNMKALNESKVVLSSRMTQIESVVIDLQKKITDLMELEVRDKTIINSLVAILSQQNKCDKNISNKLLPPTIKPNRTRRNSF